MTLIDTLHRWTGGLVGLLLAILGLSGAILVHKDTWVMLPHVTDAPIQGTAHLAEFTQRIWKIRQLGRNQSSLQPRNSGWIG